MTAEWLERPEGGSGFAMRLLMGVALGLGRPIARVVLLPVTAYFLIRRGPERRASHAYLARVLGRAPSWLEVARHVHTFSGVTLDRVYFLGSDMSRFDVRAIGMAELDHALDLGRGVLLIGAHIGSFDALRAASMLRPEITLRVVLDAEHSPALSAILKQLNPAIAAGIINPRKDGTAVALEIGAALNQGAMVAMLGDRGRPENPTARVRFLGQDAEFPTAPWQIAAALHAPIVMCAGLYRGGNRYDLHFEMLTEDLRIDRKQRQQQLRDVVQDFADRLAALLRIAPYNWFNFYDFWNDTPPGSDRPRAGGDIAARG